MYRYWPRWSASKPMKKIPCSRRPLNRGAACDSSPQLPPMRVAIHLRHLQQKPSVCFVSLGFEIGSFQADRVLFWEATAFLSMHRNEVLYSVQPLFSFRRNTSSRRGTASIVRALLNSSLVGVSLSFPGTQRTAWDRRVNEESPRLPHLQSCLISRHLTSTRALAAWAPSNDAIAACCCCWLLWQDRMISPSCSPAEKAACFPLEAVLIRYIKVSGEWQQVVCVVWAMK